MQAASLYERAWWKFSYEDDAVFGSEQKRRGAEGRKAAASANKPTGGERRAAIARAARDLWNDDPELRSNKSKTAARIYELELPELILAGKKLQTGMKADSIRRLLPSPHSK